MTVDVCPTCGRGSATADRLDQYKQPPTDGTDRERVLEFIRGRGQWGATDEEIADILGLPLATARARRRELDLGEWIVWSGSMRLTKSGGSTRVWRDAL